MRVVLRHPMPLTSSAYQVSPSGSVLEALATAVFVAVKCPVMDNTVNIARGYRDTQARGVLARRRVNVVRREP